MSGEKMPESPKSDEGTRALFDRILKMNLTEAFSPEEKEKTAILIAPGGDGQHSRLEIDWKKYAETVLVAGTRQDPEYRATAGESNPGMLEHLTTTSKTEKDNKFIYNEEDGRTDIPKNLSFKVDAKHTPDQAQWAVKELLKNPKIDNVILSTAEYHLPRFVLTFVKQWLIHGDPERILRLYVLPTQPTEIQNQTETSTNLTIEGELERIKEYQEKGDVATEEELEEFIKRAG